MPLHMQDPLDTAAQTLHERVLEAARGSSSGGAAFSYATRDGIQMLLGDPAFRRLLTRGSFRLVVGVDDITDTNALDTLETLQRLRRGFEVRAFYHQVPNTLFHPKFCWFATRTTGILIVGSGNLTARGLRKNWEAFNETRLGPVALRHVREQWASWQFSNSRFLLPINDPRVRAQAQMNAARPRQPRSRGAQGDATLNLGVNAAVLIAEIPRGGPRWSQGNFSLETFRQFFGAEPGHEHRVVLQHVNPDGSLGDIENRPAVSVASHNYRFELAAGTGVAYPAGGRPIGVFVRTGARDFTYRLAFPHDSDYLCFSGYLDDTWNGPPRQMRRVLAEFEVLQRACPATPLWQPGPEPDE